MSSRTNATLTTSVLVALIISAILSYQAVTESKNQSVNNGKDIQKINGTLQSFLKLFDDRQKIGNVRANDTAKRFDENAKQQKDLENNILGNLTSHRLVTNATFDNVKTLIHQFNMTNEVGRQKAVNQIIGSVIDAIHDEFDNDTQETKNTTR